MPIISNLSIRKLKAGTGREFVLVSREDSSFRLVVGKAAIYVFDTRYDNREYKYEVFVASASRDYENDVKILYEETDIGTFKFKDMSHFSYFLDVVCNVDDQEAMTTADIKRLWRDLNRSGIVKFGSLGSENSEND